MPWMALLLAETMTTQMGSPPAARTAGNWPTPKATPWACPRCGSAWVTPDLQPRCATCGFHESGS